MSQYDAIAVDYDRRSEERLDRSRILAPTARHYVGELAGLDALDLACGSGYFTRRLKEWGAASVLGVDLSEEMVRLARRKETERPLGLEYLVADAAEMGRLGAFDLVFAGFLLHYAPSKDALRRMCASVALNLKPGGRFVAFNENPFHPVHSGRKYDVEMRAFDPIGDEARIELAHFKAGRLEFSFSHRHYEPATYDAALRGAGFSRIEWRPFIRGASADDGLPPGYWDDFTRGDFSIAVLICVKE